MEKKIETKDLLIRITSNAVLAGLYVALSLIVLPFTIFGMSIRIAEILVFFAFFRRDYIFGLCLGTFIVNFFSPMWMLDIWIGTLATFLSCLLISFMKNMLLSCVFPIVINAFVVAIEISVFYQTPYWINVAGLAICELITVAVGYIVFMLIGKNKHFLRAINARQNLDFKF